MKKSQIKILDGTWANIIKKRAGYKCEYCHVVGIQEGGRAWLNAAHIIGRRYRGLRWDLRNGLSLCFNHHREYDMHGFAHDDIYNLVNQETKEYLQTQKNVIAKNQDFEDIKQSLLKAEREICQPNP